MTTNHFIKIGWRVCKPLALSGLMFTLAHSAYGMSCAAQPAPVQNQKQPSVEQLASLTVRSRIADSALVMQGAIESISEDHASMNWSTARLAVVRPTRIFKGNASTKYEVLVPMDTRLGEEVAIFANLESPEKIQARISFNRPEIKPTSKWTQEIRPLWIASDPCTARTYSIKKSPEIADSIKQVFGAGAAAELLIDLHVYSTGSPHQTELNTKVNLVQNKIELVSVNETRYASQIHKRNGQLNDGFFTASLKNLPEGRYTLVTPKIAGMTAVCYVNLQVQNCSSIEIKSYASHKLQGIYRPSAQIRINHLAGLMESMPIEYEFVALDAQANQPLKIRHVTGGVGDSVFLYPGKYNLFAVISGGTSDQDRRVQISAKGNKVLRLNEGINDVSIAATEFFQPVETIVKWQLPSGTDKQVSTTFKVLTEIQGYGRTYQQSAYSSCNTSECKLIALRGQSIEVIATTYKSGLITKKILRIGDEDTVNLTLAPIEK